MLEESILVVINNIEVGPFARNFMPEYGDNEHMRQYLEMIKR